MVRIVPPGQANRSSGWRREEEEGDGVGGKRVVLCQGGCWEVRTRGKGWGMTSVRGDDRVTGGIGGSRACVLGRGRRPEGGPGGKRPHGGGAQRLRPVSGIAPPLHPPTRPSRPRRHRPSFGGVPSCAWGRMGCQRQRGPRGEPDPRPFVLRVSRTSPHRPGSHQRFTHKLPGTRPPPPAPPSWRVFKDGVNLGVWRRRAEAPGAERAEGRVSVSVRVCTPAGVQGV